MIQENQQILHLIETKNFEDLSRSEQEMVLAHMSQDAYEQQRSLVARSSGLFESESHAVTPDPETLHQLRMAMAEKRERDSAPSWFMALLTIRIPIYQAGMAALVLFFAGYFFWPAKHPSNTSGPQIVYQTVHDTIELIKEIPIEQIIEKPVKVIEYIERPAPTNRLLAVTDQVSNGIVPPANPPEMAAVQHSFGNTSLNKQALERFRVGL